MSQGQPIPANAALTTAWGLVAQLEDACDRIQIAGSLRRRRAYVSDVEIVAAPRWENRVVEPGLLINEWTPVDLLEERVDELLGDHRIRLRDVETHRSGGAIEITHKNGPAYKALEADGIPVDLFVVRPPAEWGVIFALRTGPGDWNTRLVTECQAIGRRVRDGRVEVWGSGHWQPIATPEEADFFRAVGQPWLDPDQRLVERVAPRRALAQSVP